LSPILFSLYINDFVNASEFTIRLFANDTALLMSDCNIKSLGIKFNVKLIKFVFG